MILPFFCLNDFGSKLGTSIIGWFNTKLDIPICGPTSVFHFDPPDCHRSPVALLEAAHFRAGVFRGRGGWPLKKGSFPAAQKGNQRGLCGKWPIEIDGLPMKNGDLPWQTVSHNQRVYVFNGFHGKIIEVNGLSIARFDDQRVPKTELSIEKQFIIVVISRDWVVLPFWAWLSWSRHILNTYNSPNIMGYDVISIYMSSIPSPFIPEYTSIRTVCETLGLYWICSLRGFWNWRYLKTLNREKMSTHEDRSCQLNTWIFMAVPQRGCWCLGLCHIAPADGAGQYPTQVHLILGKFTEFWPTAMDMLFDRSPVH